MLGRKFQIIVITAICLLLCACSGPEGAPENETPDNGRPDSAATPDNATPESAAPDNTGSTGTEAQPAEQTPGTVHKVSPEEARLMIAEGSCILLDVRTEEEYNEAYIEGAVLIPYDEIELRAAAELPDKDKAILIYCRSGRRSALAAETLAGMGYTSIYDFGGIIDWPYETVSGPE